MYVYTYMCTHAHSHTNTCIYRGSDWKNGKHAQVGKRKMVAENLVSLGPMILNTTYSQVVNFEVSFLFFQVSNKELAWAYSLPTFPSPPALAPLKLLVRTLLSLEQCLQRTHPGALSKVPRARQWPCAEGRRRETAPATATWASKQQVPAQSLTDTLRRAVLSCSGSHTSSCGFKPCSPDQTQNSCSCHSSQHLPFSPAFFPY